MPKRKLPPVSHSADIRTQAQQDEFENYSPETRGAIGRMRSPLSTEHSRLEGKLARKGITAQLSISASEGKEVIVITSSYADYLLAKKELMQEGWRSSYRPFEVIKG